MSAVDNFYQNLERSVGLRTDDASVTAATRARLPHRPPLTRARSRPFFAAVRPPPPPPTPFQVQSTPVSFPAPARQPGLFRAPTPI